MECHLLGQLPSVNSYSVFKKKNRIKEQTNVDVWEAETPVNHVEMLNMMKNPFWTVNESNLVYLYLHMKQD